MDGRDYAIPEDVQAVLPGVAGHRLRGPQGNAADVAALLSSVAIP